VSGSGTNRRFILIRDLVSQTWFKTLNLDGEPLNLRMPLASFVGLTLLGALLVSVRDTIRDTVVLKDQDDCQKNVSPARCQSESLKVANWYVLQWSGFKFLSD
jgi:hypothetical protein